MVPVDFLLVSSEERLSYLTGVSSEERLSYLTGENEESLASLTIRGFLP